MNPAFSNGNNTAYWNDEAVRLPESYDWTLSIQRQLSSSLIFETSYNATIGAHLVSGLLRMNQVPFSAFQRYGLSVLQSNITSAAAVAAGIQRPYPSFNGSVAQALRPYPQYLDIQTREGHGDKSGHSSYHAWIAKLEKRYSGRIDVKHLLCVLEADHRSDSYIGDNSAIDHYNRRLEKSIGQYDQTHNVKASYVYELPWGKGRKWLQSGPASVILGGWRLGAIHGYTSGTPVELTNNNNYNIFNGRGAATVSTYEGWTTDLENPDWRGEIASSSPGPSMGRSRPTGWGILPGTTRRLERSRTSTKTTRWRSLSPSANLSELTSAGRRSTCSIGHGLRREAGTLTIRIWGGS